MEDVRHGKAGDREARVSAPPASGLPCLSSNNSDKPRRELTPPEKKRAHALFANVKKFVEVHGIERCGFLTITCPDLADWREFSKRFDNFNRRVLRGLFAAYVCVLEWQANGRPHFHLLVACQEDIRTGFNFDHYKAIQQWNKERRSGLRPQGKLGRNPFLKSIHDALNETREGYKIGRIELAPIRSTAEAIGRYVGGYLSKSLNAREDEDAKKGCRLVRYSRNCPRASYSAFSWCTMGAWLWRQRARCWARTHGCATPEEVLEMFGPHWAYHHRESILRQKIDHFPTAQHWEAAGEGDPRNSGLTAFDFPVTCLPQPRTPDPHEARREYEREEALREFIAFAQAGEGVPTPRDADLSDSAQEPTDRGPHTCSDSRAEHKFPPNAGVYRGGEHPVSESAAKRKMYVLKTRPAIERQPTLAEGKIRQELRALRGIDEPF